MPRHFRSAIPYVGFHVICIFEASSTGHIATLLFLPKDSSVLHRPVEIAPNRDLSIIQF
jgi:hypothetical protein